MGLRKLFRISFSGISFLFGLVLAPNVEKLMAAKGWDNYLAEGVPAKATWLTFLTVGPWALLIGVAVLAFTLGLWVDSALSKLDGRAAKRPKPTRVLGRDSLNLAHSIKSATESYVRQDATPLVAGINSIMVRYTGLGFTFPLPPENWSDNEALRMAAYYLTMIGQLLIDGHEVEARRLSEDLNERLPKMDFGDPNRF